MFTLGIYAHDGTASVVSVSSVDVSDNTVWITFGEVTPKGFSPCYASVKVPASEVKGVLA